MNYCHNYRNRTNCNDFGCHSMYMYELLNKSRVAQSNVQQACEHTSSDEGV